MIGFRQLSNAVKLEVRFYSRACINHDILMISKSSQLPSSLCSKPYINRRVVLPWRTPASA
jgi:hypothetical protein